MAPVVAVLHCKHQRLLLLQPLDGIVAVDAMGDGSAREWWTLTANTEEDRTRAVPKRVVDIVRLLPGRCVAGVEVVASRSVEAWWWPDIRWWCAQYLWRVMRVFEGAQSRRRILRDDQKIDQHLHAPDDQHLTRPPAAIGSSAPLLIRVYGVYDFDVTRGATALVVEAYCTVL